MLLLDKHKKSRFSDLHTFATPVSLSVSKVISWTVSVNNRTWFDLSFARFSFYFACTEQEKCRFKQDMFVCKRFALFAENFHTRCVNCLKLVKLFTFRVITRNTSHSVHILKQKDGHHRCRHYMGLLATFQHYWGSRLTCVMPRPRAGQSNRERWAPQAMRIGVTPKSEPFRGFRFACMWLPSHADREWSTVPGTKSLHIRKWRMEQPDKAGSVRLRQISTECSVRQCSTWTNRHKLM